MARGTEAPRAGEVSASSTLLYLQSTIDAIPAPVLVKDDRHRYVAVNGAFCDFIGRARDELLGRDDFAFFPPDHARGYQATDDQALADSRQIEYEKAYTIDGRTRWMLVRKTAIATPDGNRLLFLVLIDVTRRHLAEDALRRHGDDLQRLVEDRTVELRRAKEAAETSSRAVAGFLSNMSHELRTPMHAILGFTGLGLDAIASGSVAPDKLKRYFDRVRASGLRLLALLNDLLDLSKLEAGAMTCALGRHDLRATIDAALEEYEELIAQRGLEVDVDLAVADPHAWFDPLRIGQVVRNLLSNAVKFSPPGGSLLIRLRDATLTVEGAATTLPALAASVADEGVGIPSAELGSIFDKFVQSSRTHAGAGGTGLGLSISREIVALHGGRIHAENRTGGGAQFTLVIPRGPIEP